MTDSTFYAALSLGELAALSLREENRWSVRLIAEAQGVSERTVYRDLASARKKIAQRRKQKEEHCL